MTCPLCNDTGEQRYWEGRWRDEKAENDRLRLAADHVCWFDWSSNNDADAVAAVDELRRVLQQFGETK